MEMRRNQPNVQASDSWAAGMTSSAILRPGENKQTSQTGRADSLVEAQATARKPTNKLAMAGKIQRKKMRCGISPILSNSRQYRADGCRRRSELYNASFPRTAPETIWTHRTLCSSKALPNSNASVLTNGTPLSQMPDVGVNGLETRGGALQGEWCSPRVPRAARAAARAMIS